jgi:3-deoxy-D-manno-octulosonic-acid transferase
MPGLPGSESHDKPTPRSATGLGNGVSPALPGAAPAPSAGVDREQRLWPPVHRRDPLKGWRSGLFHGLYNLLWCLGGLLGVPVWAWKSWRRSRFRSLMAQRSLWRWSAPPPGARPRVLIHGVSVGEVKGAASLVRRVAQERPDLEVVLSSITDTGLEMARQQYPGLTAVRWPFDHSWLARCFLRRLQPSAIVLIELELWPNMLREANRLGIPVAVVNGRITARSFGRYRLLERWCPQFERISLFCAQTELYGARFSGLGVTAERLCITGNVKVDGITVGRADPGPDLRRWLPGAPGQPVWVAGSTHAPEERLVVEAWLRFARAARLVLVPRHPHRAVEVQAQLTGLGIAAQRLSDLRRGSLSVDPTQPLIVDTIGELERVYGAADLVFVGGSLIPHGGQNLLEPAAQGIPVLHGPHMHNFAQESQLLADAGASRQVADGEELGRIAAELLSDRTRAQAMGAAGHLAVARQQGATAATWEALTGSGVIPPPR